MVIKSEQWQNLGKGRSKSVEMILRADRSISMKILARMTLGSCGVTERVLSCAEAYDASVHLTKFGKRVKCF